MWEFLKKTNPIERRNIFLGAILIVCFLSLTLYSFFQTTQFKRKIQLFSNLEKAIKAEISNPEIDYSFFIKDLNFPGLELAFAKDKQFPGASLIKLPILAVAFKAVGEKRISLEDKVIIRRQDIVGGSGELKSLTLPYELTLKELLEFMIVASDNTATNKVIDLLGFKYINNGFKELGLKNTSLAREMMDFRRRRKGVENYTSCQDIVYIFEKIYNKKLINKDFSCLALSFLKKQKVSDRIPHYLPKSVVVAHKTGLEKGVVHDAGIVFAPKSDYIICVLMKDIKSFKQAKKIIAQISLLTYNLYQ